jgi:hypothetical protein
MKLFFQELTQLRVSSNKNIRSDRQQIGGKHLIFWDLSRKSLCFHEQLCVAMSRVTNNNNNNNNNNIKMFNN